MGNSPETANDFPSNYSTRRKIRHQWIKKAKLRNIAKRIVKKPQAYYSMEQNLKYWAKEYNTTIYALEDPKLEYPEEIEW